MNRRFLCLLIATTLLSATLLGCSKPAATTDKNEETTKTEETTKGGETTKGEETSGLDPVTIDDSNIQEPYGLPSNYSNYPVEGKPTIKIWWPIDGFAAVATKDMNTHEVWQEWEKLTGVNAEFEHPPVGQESDQFNIMIASGELPDVIVQSARYKGGVTAGIDDGVYIDHTEIIDKFSPNYKQFRESDEDRRKTTVDDKGRVLGYYNLAPYSEWLWFGLLIKQEALDKTGLSVPQTVDEWYTFLKKCKELGYNQPLNYGSNYGTIWTGLLNSAWGAYDWVYNDNGTAKWGPAEPGMRDYLETMAKWQKEGLLNKDWATADFNQRMASASSDDCAVIMDSPDTMWGTWKTQHNIDFVGAPYPVMNKGDKPQATMLHYKNGGWETSITAAASDKAKEVAAKFLDFGYTKKGWELANFGLQDRTHKINPEGMPYYHDESLMYNDPEGVPLSNLVWKYKLHQGPFIREEHKSNPLLVAKGSYSGKVRETWQNETSFEHAMPPFTFTPEEATKEAEVGTQLATLRTETFSKIIMGQLPITAYDDFLKKADQLGYKEWLKLYQDAMDRYNKR